MVFTSQTQLLFLYLMYYLGNMFRLVIEYINWLVKTVLLSFVNIPGW